MGSHGRFHDRSDAGRRLATLLSPYAGRNDVVVLGLPRGGVPVAREVADALGARLDVLAVRKLGVPGHEELAMGAIASGGGMVLDDEVARAVGIRPDELRRVVVCELAELDRQERAYLGDRQRVPLRGRVAVLVDDGLATGSTMRAAAETVRREEPAAVVVAVPVAPPASLARIEQVADEVVCAVVSDDFRAVSEWYDDFSPTGDADVRRALG
jgi:predicted phosphoribosyltransferase